MMNVWRVEVGDGSFGGYVYSDEDKARRQATLLSISAHRLTGKPVHLFYRPGHDRATHQDRWPRRLIVSTYVDGEEQ